MSQKNFQLFDRRWGPHTGDVFANEKNRKLSTCFSKYACPGSAGVNAFAQNWACYNNWLVPPVHLIGRTIRVLLQCKVGGTLIVPRWESAAFWPLFVSSPSGGFEKFVLDFVEYVTPHRVFDPGSVDSSVFAQKMFAYNVLVLRVSGHAC